MDRQRRETDREAFSVQTSIGYLLKMTFWKSCCVLKILSTSGPKAGDDKRKEGEEEGGGGGKEGDLDCLVELVGEEDEEH